MARKISSDDEALLREVEEFFSVVRRQPGDLDTGQLTERLGLSRERIYRKMNELVAKGEWETFLISTSSGRERIWRKKK